MMRSLASNRLHRAWSPATRRVSASCALATALLAAAAAAGAADWTNSGGNAARNGSTSAIGPSTATSRWSGGRSSLIAWLPVTEGSRLFTVRQPRWPTEQPNDAYVVASNLVSGAELWAKVLPYASGDWIPWVAGVRDGRVYCSRSGNGASVSARLYALDATDGHTLWTSAESQDAGPYDGVVFAPDGDPIVASFRYIWRFDAVDGHTAWRATRTGSVSGNCGGALFGNAFYVADAAPGGHILVRYDATTGLRQYASPVMSGFTLQNTPFVGPDGTIYLDRAQNNPGVDFYYAFRDDGTQFIEKWRVGGMGGASAEFAAGPDGSLYVIIPGPRLARLDPATGTVLNQTAILSGFASARIATDALGRVFFSNGGAASGRLHSFDADLTPRWDVAVPNINIGGPAIAADGTLIVCGTGTDVRAYHAPTATAVAGAAMPVDGDGSARNGASRMRLTSWPNPCPSGVSSRIECVGIAAAGKATAMGIHICDVNGALVRRLVTAPGAETRSAQAAWDGRDERGRPVPPGVYYARARIGAAVADARLVVIR